MMCEPGTLSLGVERLVYSGFISTIPACGKCGFIAEQLIRTSKISQRTGDNVSVSHGGRTFTPIQVRGELLKEAGWTCIELVPFLSLISQYRNYLTELAHEKTGTRISSVNSPVSEYTRIEFGRLSLGESFNTILYILDKLEAAESKLKPD